jgi:hypothetical protein
VKKGDFTVKGLWNYNLEFNDLYGRKTAGLEVFRVYLQSLNNDLINYGMKNFLTSKEAVDLGYGRVTELSLASKFKMMLKGATNISAFSNLIYVVKSMDELGKIYNEYPRSPEGFGEWRKRVNDKMSEAKARFKPNPK